MASLYRKPVMITDKATGQKVKQRSKKWWGQYKDADGRLRRKPLAVDKMAAKAMLNEIVIRLTLGLYTHVELHDQTAAIESLPAPPAAVTENETGKTAQLCLYREEERDGQDSAA
jgi:hypothetical protein